MACTHLRVLQQVYYCNGISTSAVLQGWRATPMVVQPLGYLVSIYWEPTVYLEPEDLKAEKT